VDIKMTSIAKVAGYLINNAESLAVEIVEDVLRIMNLEIPKWEKEQAITMYIEFIGFLGNSLIDDDENGVPDALIEWSKKNAEGQVLSGGKISEIVVRYPSTRETFTDILTRISLEFGLSLKENAYILKRINAILDISLNETIFAFEQISDQYKKEIQIKIDELSAPVILIKEGIAILPLIGAIDSDRATYILDKVVPKIAELKLNYLIVDFSGILTIDVEIARYLYQIENVLRLLGICTILTGLRPELARTIVNGGFDMSSIQTFSHLKRALESL
jgi:rsbT co-antagonist protein RsbR